MVFNSLEFLIFFPIVFVSYWFVFQRSLRLQNLFLLLSSYLFYGWWSWKFLLLLAFSTFLDYFYGFGVSSESKKKAKLFLWLSVINNLGILAFFKYFNFFIKEFENAFDLIGIHFDTFILNLTLPVGISFYTFHGMSYVFDIYRKKQIPVKNIFDYALFVSFFPLLVAGPIERANHLIPQVISKRNFTIEKGITGLNLIFWGFFKKVVIADNLALGVNEIFKNSELLHSFTLILGAIYFSFQIYCDFSGYTDIARGVANLLGFDLLLNFNNPYLSKSIPDFWKKWHISLSSWFRDYLYIPLGGSKVSKILAIRNVMLVFILSGFWHGANWTFLIWGFIHAICFLPFFLKRKYSVNNIKIINTETNNYISNSFKIVTTFSIVTFAWIFFRSENIKTAFIYIENLFTFKDSIVEFVNWRCKSTQGSHLEFIFILIVFGLSTFVFKINYLPLRYSILIILILFFGCFVSPSNFIYFQF